MRKVGGIRMLDQSTHKSDKTLNLHHHEHFIVINFFCYINSLDFNKFTRLIYSKEENEKNKKEGVNIDMDVNLFVFLHCTFHSMKILLCESCHRVRCLKRNHERERGRIREVIGATQKVINP